MKIQLSNVTFRVSVETDHGHTASISTGLCRTLEADLETRLVEVDGRLIPFEAVLQMRPKAPRIARRPPGRPATPGSSEATT